MYVIIAIANATGTNHVAHLSAILCVGACFSSAFLTILINFSSEESLPIFVEIISMAPYKFKVPAYTSSLTVLSSGSDSPVITD